MAGPAGERLRGAMVTISWRPPGSVGVAVGADHLAMPPAAYVRGTAVFAIAAGP